MKQPPLTPLTNSNTPEHYAPSSTYPDVDYIACIRAYRFRSAEARHHSNHGAVCSSESRCKQMHQTRSVNAIEIPWQFHLVTVRAAEEMKKRKPDLTDQQISEKFKTASDAVAKQIDDLIRVNGCSDPRIQDLLKRFEVQANLKFGG